MEWIGSLCVFLGITLFLYTVIKRYEAQRVGASRIKQQLTAQKLQDEEQHRRAQIIHKVESFLKGSQFVEPIAKWRDEEVFKYVFNEACVYEFEDFMNETSQKVGMDDEHLCFKRLCYKRVSDPVEFLSRWTQQKSQSGLASL